MTDRARIAAEVSARYRLPVSPDVVQIIPRGVSAFAIGEMEMPDWREQRRIAFRAMILNRQRISRVVKANRAAEKAAEAETRPVQKQDTPAVDDEALKIAGAVRREKTRGPFVPREHWLKLLLAQGKTAAEIAPIFDLTVPGLKRMASLAGVPFPKPAPKPRDTQAIANRMAAGRKMINAGRHEAKERRQDQIAAWAREGWTLAQMVAASGVSAHRVSMDLNARGLSWRNGAIHPYVPINPKDAEERPAKVIALREAGLTLAQIAAKLGVGVATVHADWQRGKAA